jgi:hypothetical protein
MPSKSEKKVEPITTTNHFVVIRLKKIHVLLLVALLLGLLYFMKGWIVAAVVDGKPITRHSLIKELEQERGKSTLAAHIDKVLIQNEAKRHNVQASEEELAKEIKVIEQNLSTQGKKLDDVLATEGMTRDTLNDQIRLQITVNKLLEKDVAVTEKEIADFIEQNKASIPEEMTKEVVQAEARKQLGQQKLQQAYQPWIEGLRKKASIWYFVDYK